VKCGEDVSIGTGWFMDLPPTTPSTPSLRLIVTNDHVLDKHSSFRVLTKEETELGHSEVELLLAKTGVDMALIRLVDTPPASNFCLSTDVPLLEDVITIGYPAVPLSREAYQVVHRGEVNAQVADMWGQDLLVISARTAPGSSGSPVIDDTGRVVGMVARELFEKSTFQEKGITPYSACIPAKTILSALYQSNIYKRYTTDFE
jgi:S1-C subfamily serine protease